MPVLSDISLKYLTLHVSRPSTPQDQEDGSLRARGRKGRIYSPLLMPYVYPSDKVVLVSRGTEPLLC